ncbi:cysteine hydrolase family protein [Rhodococcus spongiicola]|uniref:Cysteine hydrolase n=1 Tax=Rhodococcus spongiicola TaxID=2487352 RepID=A0A438B4P1_9NOCA|nr:isochorismatase family cysteine hydrolase [Rhodococcus spongiicola]RVW05956.1 cysteine hydrolase [Rhodococcus spongiicola]
MYTQTTDSVVDTEPNVESCALITIDVQTDFSRAGGATYVEGTEPLLPTMAKIATAFRRAGKPIVHVVRLYERDGSNAELCRRNIVADSSGIAAPGSEGSQLDVALRPSPDVELDPEWLLGGEFQKIAHNEWLMFKPRWGAFYETNLRAHLHQLGVDSLVFIGANFPNCPRTSIYEATERDFRVAMASDGISRTYDRGLEECRGIGVRVMSSDEICRWVEPRLVAESP